MQKRKLFGLIFIIIGFVVFFLKPISNLTGFTIVENIQLIKDIWFYVIGAGLIIFGAILGGRESIGGLEKNIAQQILKSGAVITKTRKLMKEVRKIEKEMGYSGRYVKEGYQILDRYGTPLTVVPQHPDISKGVYYSIMKALATGESSFRRYTPA